MHLSANTEYALLDNYSKEYDFLIRLIPVVFGHHFQPPSVEFKPYDGEPRVIFHSQTRNNNRSERQQMLCFSETKHRLFGTLVR
jgi:hypothetical protein